MALESWELIIFNLALGSLISGFILFFFSIFTAGFHSGNSGHAHVGHTNHLGHFGHWAHLPHIGHFHIGHFHIGHVGHAGHAGHVAHGSHSNVHAHQGGKLDQNPSTPILLIISAFMLMFGAIGTVIYQLQVFDPIFRLFSVILIPLLAVKLVSMGWGKLMSNEFGYAIPTVNIDNQVRTLTAVDENGGLVLADTGDLSNPDSVLPDEQIKMFARTLPGVSMERNNIAYVIDIDPKNALIIDFWPRIAKKKLESSENTLN